MSEGCQVSQSQDQDLRGGGRRVRRQQGSHSAGLPAEDSLPCTATEAPSPRRDPPHGRWEHEEDRNKTETETGGGFRQRGEEMGLSP